MEGYWKGHGLFLRAGRSSLSLSEGKKLLILSLLCAAGVVSVSLAVSSSRSCGLMMKFRALDHCQLIGDLGYEAVLTNRWFNSYTGIAE